jgi:hypothetical protein
MYLLIDYYDDDLAEDVITKRSQLLSVLNRVKLANSRNAKVLTGLRIIRARHLPPELPDVPLIPPSIRAMRNRAKVYKGDLLFFTVDRITEYFTNIM